MQSMVHSLFHHLHYGTLSANLEYYGDWFQFNHTRSWVKINFPAVVCHHSPFMAMSSASRIIKYRLCIAELSCWNINLFEFILSAVERGLAELRRLGIETQLWEESRKELEEHIDASKRLSRSDF